MLNNYFNHLSTFSLTKFNKKSNRFFIKGLNKKSSFNVGDIIEVVSFKKNLPFIFEGVCIALKKKSFLSPDLSFILRMLSWVFQLRFVFLIIIIVCII